MLYRLFQLFEAWMTVQISWISDVWTPVTSGRQ